MQWVRNVIGQRRLFENPLAILRAAISHDDQRQGNSKQSDRQSPIAIRQVSEQFAEGICPYHLNVNERIAAPYAPAVTRATGTCALAMPCTRSPLLFSSKAMAPRIGVRIMPGP